MVISVRRVFLISLLMPLLFTTFSLLNKSYLGMPVQPKSEHPIIEPVSISAIQPGDILLMRGNTFVDRVIESVTRSPYSHVVGVVNSNQVIEISPLSTVKYQNLKDYLARADVYTSSQLSADDRKKIVDYVTAKLGTPYNYKLIIWETTRYLFNWVWSYETEDSSLCSTLWSEAYHKAGIDLCPDIKYPAPGDLSKSRYLHKLKSY